MATVSISLSDSDFDFVQRQVAIGRFSTPSEYFQALIGAERLLEQEPAEMSSELEAELLKGLDSGPAVRMTEADWEDMRNKAIARWRDQASKRQEPKS
jgi:putative addiction module CopG family antidote